MCFTCIPGILVSWEIYRARAKPGEPMFGFVARGGIFSYFSHSVQINSIVDAHKHLLKESSVEKLNHQPGSTLLCINKHYLKTKSRLEKIEQTNF